MLKVSALVSTRARIIGWIYVALLVASHVVIALRGTAAPEPPPAGTVVHDLDLPRMTDSGPEPAAQGGAAKTYRLRVLEWPAKPGVPERLPVVLLHGAPSGGGSDFAALAPMLAERGSRVLAPDLPASGASGRDAPSYSISAAEHLVLAAMDALGVQRAHIVGWSQGGGPAILLADREPERVVSLTMLASIGTQETEGSGSYFFEHLKYRIGHALVGWAPELIPHFGLLGDRSHRLTLLRPFMDTDLRPMQSVLRRLATPTLILHGRHDFLVAASAAEEHHEMIGPSTLVMLRGDHFMPLGNAMPVGKDDDRQRQLEETASHTLAFMNQQELAGPVLTRGSAVFAPPEAHITQKLGGFKVSRDTPWWLIILIITLATMITEDLTIITVGILIASQSIDWGVALIGCFFAIVVGDFGLYLIGRTLGRRVLKLPLFKRVLNESSLQKWGRVLDKHTGKAVMLSRCLPGTRMPTFIAAGVLSRNPGYFVLWVSIAAFVWTPFLLGMTMLVGPRLLEVFRTVFHGPWAIVAAIAVMYLVIRWVGYETTEMGRDRLKADLKRFISPEFWPAWAFYLPMVPYYLWLSARHGGPMTPTAANPGIPEGGGVIGESKAQILSGFDPADAAMVAPFALIAPGDDHAARAAAAIEQVRTNAALRGYPVVLKPDQGFRGYGVKIARTDEDVRRYFQVMTRPVIVQAYHPGPNELGVLWARRPVAGEPVDQWPGEIFSVTHKEFPVVVGDGKRTLEVLIWDHPRLRMQGDVFTRRFDGQTDKVLGDGEVFPLGLAGNHCQGAKFTDGMHLVSQSLAQAIERLARNYRDAEGRRLDFVRFDLRYTDAAALARGEGFAIVECNGTASESTSMYDPHKSIFWTYGLLFGHWKRLFLIAQARRREGTRPMTFAHLANLYRQHRAHKPGSGVSD